MAIENIVMRNKDTGNKIWPETSLENIVGAEKLLNSNDVYITPESTQIPSLGQNVNSVSNFASRIFKVGDFKIYYFTGMFTVKKDMFADSANSFDTPRRVLFSIPDEIYQAVDQLQLQEFVGRLRGVAEARNFIFRYLHGNIHWDGFQYPMYINSADLPDTFDIEISGRLYTRI